MQRLLLAGCLAAVACTKADLFGTADDELVPPDRAVVTGELCTDDTSSADFPVKVLYVFDATDGMFRADPDLFRFCGPGSRCAFASLQGMLERYQGQPHVRFGFVSAADAAVALPPPDGQRFLRPEEPEVPLAVAGLQAPGGTRRRIEDALSQIESFIDADVARGAAGEVLRTRYLVVMVLSGPPYRAAGVSAASHSAALAARAAEVRERILARGALDVRLHVALLYYGPRTIAAAPAGYGCYAAGAVPCTCPTTGASDAYCSAYCDVQAGAATEAHNTEAATTYTALAFAGGGAVHRFGCAAHLDLEPGIAAGEAHLVRKEIVAYNRNVVLSAGGPATDSDGDGLTDDEETNAPQPTSPTSRDTDGDYLSDMLELRAAPRQDPLVPDRPHSCADPQVLGAAPDRDGDLLNDCEEGILGTSPTIPDTDGDGLPDFLELASGTVPTAADRLLDYDGDGLPNAVEVIEHTDPRGDDGLARGAESYRNVIVPLGERLVATMADAPELPGVVFRRASPQVVGGRALLRYDTCAGTLEWSDARVEGDQRFTPVVTPLSGQSGEHRLRATAANGEEIWVEVMVDVARLPACAAPPLVVARPLVTVSPRSCYQVRITNIKLVETQAADGEPAGINRIVVFFTQGPPDRLATPGIARLLEMRVSFACGDPDDVSTCRRNPADGILEVTR